MDFTRHGYPLVYGSLALMILIIALFSYWLAKPLQPKSIRFGPWKSPDPSWRGARMEKVAETKEA